MHERLRDAVAEVKRREDIRALLLTGAGRGFCAGQDLSDRAVKADAAPVDLGYTLSTFYNPPIRTLRELPKPVICAGNGVAAGAGANLALAADVVIAGTLGELRPGVLQDRPRPRLRRHLLPPRLAGTARAMGLALLGDKLSAEDAERWGLDLEVRRRCRADGRGACARQALRRRPDKGDGDIKRAIYASATNTLDAQLDLERDLQRELGKTADYREGVRAFLEKRAPKFTGR